MSHTPGPWDYTKGVVWGVQADQYGDPEQFQIAECYDQDAPLIAAAPESNAACIAFVEAVKTGGKGELNKAYAMAKAAIAKAEGKP